MKTLNCYYNIFNSSIIAGHGCYIVDEKGKKYIDFEAGIWCMSLGHNNAEVNQAIIRQLSNISHVGERYSSKIVDEAAEVVLELLNFNNGKCIFLSSGSEAVEFSVQATRKITARPYFLCLKNSFLSSYGTSASRCTEDWISLDLSQYNGDAKAFLKNIPFEKIGAFVFESGCVLRMANVPKELINTIAHQIKQSGGITIANEVTTGIGRTGKWFGFEHFDITPDIVVCGKGIGNGYPVSVIAMRENIAAKIEQCGFKYCQSHQNDPLGCAVVKQVITTIKEQSLIEKAVQMGIILESALRNLTNKHNDIKEVCGIGLMYLLEFNTHNNLNLEKIHRNLFDAGFIVGHTPATNTFVIYPPLIIEQKMIEAMVNQLNSIIAAKKFPSQ